MKVRVKQLRKRRDRVIPRTVSTEGRDSKPGEKQTSGDQNKTTRGWVIDYLPQLSKGLFERLYLIAERVVESIRGFATSQMSRVLSASKGDTILENVRWEKQKLLVSNMGENDIYNIHRVLVYNCIKISLQGDLIYLTLSQRFCANLCHA